MPSANRKTAAPTAKVHSLSAAVAAPVATARAAPVMPQEVLRQAAEVITQRGAQRDTATGMAAAPQERSMAATVAAFNAIHKTNLTETQGWAFMQTLKMVRAATSARNGLFNADDYLDGAAYAALGHESAEAEGKPSLAFAPN